MENKPGRCGAVLGVEYDKGEPSLVRCTKAATERIKTFFPVEAYECVDCAARKDAVRLHGANHEK